jgi:hypothetical protein
MIGMLNESQKRTKRPAFSGVDVQHARQHGRLVGDDAQPSARPGAQSRPRCSAQGFVDLEELAVIHRSSG